MNSVLEPLRDDPLPPSLVDLGRVLEAGRRRVRHRRLAALTAGCAVIGVAIGAVALAANTLRPGGGSGVTPAAPSELISPGPLTPLPAAAPTTFDPLQQYAGFGWLPDGLTEAHIATATDEFELTASTPMIAPGREGDPVRPAQTIDRIAVRLVSAGHDIALAESRPFATAPGSTAGWAEVTPADPVRGRTARWNAKPGTALRWEYAPGAWAEVIVAGRPGGADPRTTARRVAESLRYDLGIGIRLPFTIANLPPTLRPMAVSRSATTIAGPGRGWTAEVDYGAGARTTYGDWPLTILVLPNPSQTGDNSLIGHPNTTVDGHPARRSTMGGGGNGLQLFNVDGLYLELSTHDAATDAQLPGGGLDGLSRAMTLFPDMRDWQ